MKIVIPELKQGPFDWGSFAGGFGGSAVSGLFGLANAALQHKYEKENMAIQNSYNIQAEERSNAYNAPSAVRARMEQAGMNPQAFMGQSSGAGIQGGMSSAPTPSTSASMGSIDTSGISNLGSVMAQNRATDVARQRMEQENRLTEEKITAERYNNEVLLPLQARIKSALADKGESEAIIAKVEASFAPAFKNLELAIKSKTLEGLKADIDRVYSQIKVDKSYIALNDASKEKILADINLARAQTYKTWVESKRTEVLTSLEATNLAMDNALKQAQKGKEEALTAQLQKDVELIGAKIGLTQEQRREVKNRIARDWAQFGIKSAQVLSSEIREWTFDIMTGGLRGMLKKQGKDVESKPLYSYEEPYMFAD